MNVECSQEVLDELANSFKFNDAVLRNLVIRRDSAITEESQLARGEEKEQAPRRSASDEDLEAAKAVAAEDAPAAEESED